MENSFTPQEEAIIIEDQLIPDSDFVKHFSEKYSHNYKGPHKVFFDSAVEMERGLVQPTLRDFRFFIMNRQILLEEFSNDMIQDGDLRSAKKANDEISLINKAFLKEEKGLQSLAEIYRRKYIHERTNPNPNIPLDSYNNLIRYFSDVASPSVNEPIKTTVVNPASNVSTN